MDKSQNNIKINKNENNLPRKSLIIFLMVFIQFISLINGVKADFGETIATIIFYSLITVFICAGIGWWQKRQEGITDDEK